MCAIAPVLAPVTAIAFGAIGVYEFGKSGFNIIKHSANGEFDKAEKDFEGLGAGTINTVLTVLGVKQSARATKEAQLLSKNKTTKLTNEEISAIKTEVKSLNLFSAFKESLKLFTTKEGRQSFLYQFSKPVLKERLFDLKNIVLRKKEQTKEVVNKREVFAKTPEGIRRAQMTTAEIEQEISKLSKESFEQYGISESLQPKIEIVKKNITDGGGYNPYKHTIEINENAYRAGAFDLPNVIRHEATHAKEALIREVLTFTKKEQLTKEYLLNKIQTGDNNTVAYKVSLFGMFGNSTMKPPKMSAGMKADFSEFAKIHLYKIGSKHLSEKEITTLVEPLLNKHPEFISQYGSKENALNELSKYALSHQLRFNIGTSASINLPSDKLAQLGHIEQSRAIESFNGHLECLDGNMANNTMGKAVFGVAGDFSQYEFGAEEVLAQLSGNIFQISHLQKELETLRKQANYDKTHEAYLLGKIESAEKTILYKTKGQKFYKLFMDYEKNPTTELKNQITQLERELNQLRPYTQVTMVYVNEKPTIMINLKGEKFILKQTSQIWSFGFCTI